MQDPIKLSERDSRPKRGHDGVDLRRGQPSVQGVDSLSHFDAVVDLRLGFTFPAEHFASAPAIGKTANLAAVSALRLHTLPPRGDAGLAYAYSELPRVPLGYVASAVRTDRQSHGRAALLLNVRHQRFDVGDAFATCRPGENGVVVP